MRSPRREAASVTLTWTPRIDYTRLVHVLQNTRCHIRESLQKAKKKQQHKLIIKRKHFSNSIITWNTLLADSLRVYSAGESIGADVVNFLSNCETSSSLVNVGLNGGSNLRDITSFQLICLKNWWFFICSASDGTEPSLWWTCLCKKLIN